MNFTAANIIKIIKSNSYPVSSNYIIPGPGLYFNQIAAIEAINVFVKYEALTEALKIGSSLITNLETKIVYQEKILTNTIKISDNSLKLYQVKMKRNINRSFIVSMTAVGVGIFGGVLAVNDNRALSYTGFSMIGAAGLTIPIFYLIVRFKKYTGLLHER